MFDKPWALGFSNSQLLPGFASVWGWNISIITHKNRSTSDTSEIKSEIHLLTNHFWWSTAYRWNDVLNC